MLDSPNRPAAEKRLKELTALYSTSTSYSPPGLRQTSLKASLSSAGLSPTSSDRAAATPQNGSTGRSVTANGSAATSQVRTMSTGKPELRTAAAVDRLVPVGYPRLGMLPVLPLVLKFSAPQGDSHASFDKSREYGKLLQTIPSGPYGRGSRTESARI